MKQFFLLLTLALLISCAGEPSQNGVTPEKLLLDLTNNERYASTEQVADWIINQDPSLRLVDVRDHAAYDAFSLPGALHIPLENLLKTENQAQLDCERYMIVFYSNDDLSAGQAWLLSRRMGCNNSYIMQGGLNRWTETILNPVEPAATASAEEMELYQYRKAIGQYFIGGSEAFLPEAYQETRQQVAPKKSIEVAPKKKKAVEEEGC